MSPTPEPGVTARSRVVVDPGPSRSPLAIAWRLGMEEVALALLGLLGLLTAAFGAPAAVLAVFAVVMGVVLVLAARSGVAEPAAGTGVPGRLLLLGALVVIMTPGDAAGWVAALVMAAAVVGEVAIAGLARVSVPFGAHLPGAQAREAVRIPDRIVSYVNAAALLVVLLLAELPVWSVLSVVAAGVSLLVTAYAAMDHALVVRSRRRAERRVRRALDAYAPRFAVHWDAAPGTGYQIGRWIPYLELLGQRYVVFVRNPRSFAEATRLTAAPVLLRRGARELDPVMVDSLRCVFYVNNALRNVHVVRYPGIRHVQLNHGDSDKATSYNPVFRMFDKNFVAGQAAIDRFAAHGVSTSPDFFVIVGRPQVSDVEVAAPGTPVRRILYAPTWAGMHADSAYSSLPIGPAIVRGLLQRDCVVVYRPHPYTDKTPALKQASEQVRALLAADAEASGRAHVFGQRAEREWSITDCFNAADALISDVSSVVPDFLYSGKPFAITAMGGAAENFRLEDFYAEMPVARGGYVVAADAGNFDSVLDDLLGQDPHAAVRRELKTYYLGDLPSDRYVETFLEAARVEIA